MMRPLARAATAISPASVRSDLGAVVTLGRLLPRLLSVPLSATKALMQPYSAVIEGEVENAFIRNWLDMLCFLLSGAPASGTAAAEIGFMFDDWFRPNAALEYPVGGSGALVDALVRGLEKHGGRLELRAPVAEVLLDEAGAPAGRPGRGRFRGGLSRHGDVRKFPPPPLGHRCGGSAGGPRHAPHRGRQLGGRGRCAPKYGSGVHPQRR